MPSAPAFAEFPRISLVPDPDPEKYPAFVVKVSMIGVPLAPVPAPLAKLTVTAFPFGQSPQAFAPRFAPLA